MPNLRTVNTSYVECKHPHLIRGSGLVLVRLRAIVRLSIFVPFFLFRSPSKMFLAGIFSRVLSRPPCRDRLDVVTEVIMDILVWRYDNSHPGFLTVDLYLRGAWVDLHHMSLCQYQ